MYLRTYLHLKTSLGICNFATISDARTVITIPVYLKELLKKNEKKAFVKRHKQIQRKSRLGNLSIPVIACKNSELDHHLGRVYPKNTELPLASRSWLRNKYDGDYFVIEPYGQNPSLEKEDSLKTFQDLNLHSEVIDAIQKLGYQKPTCIQSQAIPVLLQDDNVVCCAETGSGKTLAYLAPMFHRIIERRKSLKPKEPKNSPLGLILVPGRELAEQVGTVAATMALSCGIGVKVLVGGGGVKLPTYPENTGSEIVIATIGTMKKLADARVYNINHIQQLVVDECDTMVDDTFADLVNSFLRDVNIQEKDGDYISMEGAQLALVGATVPRDLTSCFEEILDTDSLIWVKTPFLHKLMPHVRQTFLRLRPENKAEKLLQLLTTKEKPTRDPIIIFTNRAKSAYFVSKFLEENGIPNASLNGDATIQERRDQFAQFQNGEKNILVSTDLGSRGLDTTRARHIINFEFPLHMSDYIHRVGRTGRVGTKEGKCTNFIATKVEIPLVQKIEMAARLTVPLPNVNANIKRQIGNYIASKGPDYIENRKEHKRKFNVKR